MRALDNMNYRKMKKMIMSDVPGEAGEEGSSDGDNVSADPDLNDKEEQVRQLSFGVCDIIRHMFSERVSNDRSLGTHVQTGYL